MVDEPSNQYLGAVLGACLLAVVGAWLPWVRKSVRYLDGDPYVTGEGLQGLWTGFRGVDILILGAVGLAVVVTLLARYRGRSPDVGIAAAGAGVLWTVDGFAREYWAVDHYVVRPGLALVLVGGILLVVLGAGRFLGRYLTAGGSESVATKFGSS